LAVVDAALQQVTALRADLGAVQNRLESTSNNISVTLENISAARSQIVDADIAAETAELTRSQILQQAGVAVLGQANAASQIALSLLRF
jgi:flagellin